MLLLAHRGLPGPDRLENSAAAVAAARAAGADGCEVDLRLTADGVLVAAHDEELTRYGAPGRRVSRSRADRLPLARLPELVDAVDGGRLVLELKAPPDGDAPRTVRALAGALRHLPRADLVVSSFSPALAEGARDLGLRTALLGEPDVRPSLLVALAAAAGHAQVHPHVTDLLADPAATALADRAGLEVVPWTVNEPEHAQALASCAGLISDVPQLLDPRLRGSQVPRRPAAGSRQVGGRAS